MAVAIVIAALCAILIVTFQYSHKKNPPQAITISACRDVASGTRRIKSDFGIRFDVPEKAFTVHAGLRDMPGGTLYVITLRGTDAKMVVWRDDEVFRDLKIAYPAFSKHVETRRLRDEQGHSFGIDKWGYLQNGERWRFVKFSTGDAVGYDPEPLKQADLLDQVLDSACVLH